MWTQESKAPIVQMGLSQESMNAHPVGQVVRFSVWAKMKCASLRSLERCFPTGRAIMVATMRMMFMATKTVCSFPMILDKVEARTPWSRTQQRKTA